MALYSLGVNIDGGSAVTGTWAIAEIRTGERRAKLFELTYVNSAAAVPALALGRSDIIGSGGTPIAFTPDDPNDPASTTFVYGTWSRRPTDPGVYMRRFLHSPGAQGAGNGWWWRSGLVIPPYSSVVLWNVIATDPSPGEMSFVIEE